MQSIIRAHCTFWASAASSDIFAVNLRNASSAKQGLPSTEEYHLWMVTGEERTETCLGHIMSSLNNAGVIANAFFNLGEQRPYMALAVHCPSCSDTTILTSPYVQRILAAFSGTTFSFLNVLMISPKLAASSCLYFDCFWCRSQCFLLFLSSRSNSSLPCFRMPTDGIAW